MKKYDLVEMQPNMRFDYGMLEHLPTAEPVIRMLNAFLQCVDNVTFVEEDCSEDVRDILENSDEARDRFVARHSETAHFCNRATLGIGRPTKEELFFSLRSIHDEYRNWKFSAAIDESSPANNTGFLDPVKELALLYTSIENVDMTRDIFYAFFKDKVVEMCYHILHAAFSKPLEMFNSMYDGVIRGAAFSVTTSFRNHNICGLTLQMEKDESV